VRYLLDTCTLLWLANGDEERLPQSVQEIFKSESNEIAISAISVWEIAMKAAVGRLAFPGGSVSALMALCANQFIDVQPLTPEQIERFLLLPPNHPDPFDRLIAAISLIDPSNPFTILSPDTAFDAYAAYGVTRVW
jgi:PIN domain nuclease of toxin-antitoxin system